MGYGWRYFMLGESGEFHHISQRVMKGLFLAPSRLPEFAGQTYRFAMLFIASPALAGVTGTARVIDGDTLDIAGERIRFHGIDAPESRQTCIASGATWPCGQRASVAVSQ